MLRVSSDAACRTDPASTATESVATYLRDCGSGSSSDGVPVSVVAGAERLRFPGERDAAAPGVLVEAVG